MAGDTHPDARARQVAAWRAMTPEERATLAFEMSAAVEELAVAGMRALDPAIGGLRLHHELTRRRYGSVLATAVYADLLD